MNNLLLHFSSGTPWQVLLDALTDSAIILPFLLLAHILMAVIDRFAGKKTYAALKGPLSPLIGSVAGTLPQCGFSAAAARMYAKKYIPLGALLAVFIATSDEAVFVLLKSADGAQKLLPLLLIKLFYALLAGYFIILIAGIAEGRRKKRAARQGGSVKIECTAENDLGLFFYKKGRHDVPPATGLKDELNEIKRLSETGGAQNNNELKGEIPASNHTDNHTGNHAGNQTGEHKGNHTGNHAGANEKVGQDEAAGGLSCGCGCGAGHSHKQSKLDFFLLHPLRHSLIIFAYILAINIIIGYILYFVTPQRVEDFLVGLGGLQPFLAGLIGLIPNCASSVIIADMYAEGLITLGAAVAGLSTGAGIGTAVLIKENKNRIQTAIIILAMFVCGVLVGTLTDVISVAALSKM